MISVALVQTLRNAGRFCRVTMTNLFGILVTLYQNVESERLDYLSIRNAELRERLAVNSGEVLLFFDTF